MKKRLTIKINKLSLNEMSKIKTDCLVLGINSDKSLNKNILELDKKTEGSIKRLQKKDYLKGNIGSSGYLAAPKGINSDLIYLIGIGKSKEKLSMEKAKSILSSMISSILTTKAKNASIIVPDMKVEGQDLNWVIQQLSYLAENNSYTYDAKINKKDKKVISLKKIDFYISSSPNALIRKSLKIGQAIGRGSNTAKDFGNLPGNICTPSYLGNQSKAAARKYKNLKCRVLGEKEMEKLGMHCLLSVGAGSAQESKLVILEYSGGKKGDKPHALVGKGITFDTGGISLKPGASMDEMKFDMCGAASVISTIQVMAELKVPLNVVAIVASAENMPGSKATKPGDVVKTLSGQTVEILNTDAEGRLVLADALTYVKKFDPKTVTDVATLTGACIIALGHATSGLMSNSDKHASNLFEAGLKSQDKAWRLPIWDVYQKDLNSNFADIANIGGRAGTITAACFLSRFTKDYEWAHLDVAGTAHLSGPAKGSSGRPVPLLSQFLLDKA
ncbi:MAG: leucyl aminopeptidase [Gammaproteobacteria bacterium]